MAYNSDKKPLELDELTSLANDDTFVVGDSSDTSKVVKRISKSNLLTQLQNDINTSGVPGDVVGPASATDNAIARFDGTTGKAIQDSEVIVSDRGSITQTGSDNSGGYIASDSTARLTQETYQKVEFPGHYGEVQRIIWRDKLAKSVIAFQDGADSNFATPLSKAWLVAHNLSNGTQPYTNFAAFPATVYGPNTTPAQADWYYFDETANRFYQWTGTSTTNNGTIATGSWVLLAVADEPYGPRHQHFSIETTDDGGENLYTRWAIQYY